MLRVVRVGGDSMSPTLENGDFVVALGAPLARQHRAGDVVIVDHARLGLIVKRIAELDPSGNWVQLEGDSAASTTREALGRVPCHHVKGRAILRIAPAPRGTSRLPRGLPRRPPSG
ncbi:MAG TPA: S24/S26 family peptidase [Polyangiaceae bacterium]|nr:S24/S26 family peptidase [Polyangiaceae bacterium]